MLLAPSAIAQNSGPYVSHTIRYDVSGLISIDRTLGHECTTGAVKNQTILGYGDLLKYENVRMVPHIISHQDETSWSVPADAVSGLVVTTTIDLCARPMKTAAANYVYLTDVFTAEQLELLETASLEELRAIQESINDERFILEGDLISPYHPLVVDGLVRVNPKTEQVWGTRITTTPGNEGLYEVDFRAAYGPGPREVDGVQIDLGRTIFYSQDQMWWFDDTKEDGYDTGRFYVGNYFYIDQHAYTSDGTMQRLISMSSPFYNTLLYDNVNVAGQAEIKEAFSMENLTAGRDARTLLWHDLF